MLLCKKYLKTSKRKYILLFNTVSADQVFGNGFTGWFWLRAKEIVVTMSTGAVDILRFVRAG